MPPEPVVNDPIVNPVNDDGAWREGIAGDNAETLEALKAFETPTALYESHQALSNKNWRDDFAGDDAALGKQLERFATPADYSKSFQEAQNTIRSGNIRQELAADADDATVAKYREDNGIPAEAGGYLEGLPDGLVVGEEDTEVMGDFMGALHAANAPPEAAHAAIAWYNKFAEQQQQALVDLDGEHAKESEDSLRNEWGTDYRANINLVGGLLDKTFGEEAKEAILNSRGPDGRGVFNMPEIMQGLATLARQIDPINQIISPQGDPKQTLDDEIGEIEKYMRDKRSEYMKDDKAQARLRDLYDIRLQHEKAQG